MSESLALWTVLGDNMRRLREARGVSLRQAEVSSGRSRSMLSLAENAKAQPSRELVEWYDEEFGADGLLLATYAEARAAGTATSRTRATTSSGRMQDDAMRVTAVEPPAGQVVPAGGRVTLAWRLCNDGAVTWTGRRLQRVGSVGGVRLLTSVRAVDVPETPPGSHADVRCTVLCPNWPGTVVGYWEMVNAAGQRCFPDDPPISAVLAVE